jgi:hypothetical protein
VQVGRQAPLFWGSMLPPSPGLKISHEGAGSRFCYNIGNPSSKLHGVTSQETDLTILRTSNLGAVN